MAASCSFPRDRRWAAVTGIGVVTPVGETVQDLWDGLQAGRSGAAPITRFDATALPVRFACEASTFDPRRSLGAKEARRLDRFAQFALAAAVAALDDAGSPPLDPERAAVVAGSGFGGIGSLDVELTHDSYRDSGRTNPLLIPMLMPNASAALVAMRLGWRGPNLSIGTACASAGHALGESLRLLRSGEADIVLAGGAEAPITRLVVAAFSSLQALSTRNREPARASRPFDADRDGFVLGEGAAFLVLEDPVAAYRRDARVYALLGGYGRNSDAHHLVMPLPDGRAAAACMAMAMADAGVAPSDVAAVSAHGTSTLQNDAAEAAAIALAFGGVSPAVTAVKGAVGHLIGAAGAIGAVAACLALRHGAVPPVANVERVDDGLGIDVIRDSPRPLDQGGVIVNAFGFGGHNASLVFMPAA